MNFIPYMREPVNLTEGVALPLKNYHLGACTDLDFKTGTREGSGIGACAGA